MRQKWQKSAKNIWTFWPVIDCMPETIFSKLFISLITGQIVQELQILVLFAS